MLEKLKVSIHQINTITGDLDGNTQKIKDCIKSDYNNVNVDISIFPETAISGYMCGSLWDRVDFIKNQISKLNEIKNYCKNISGVVIVGFVSLHGTNKNGFPVLMNSVAVINNGKIRTYHKQLLADSDHHEDKKYFKPGTESKVFDVELPNVGKIKIGIPICEDSWFFNHHRDISEEMVEMGAELLIIPNQSYFYYGKQDIRRKLFSKIAKNNNVPVISVNSIGIGDILKNIVIFDGGSLVINDNGMVLKELPRFTECSDIFILGDQKPIILEKYNKYKEITDAIIFEQKEFFRLNGIKNAQVHVSGGLDSSIVAALVVKSMGVENSVLISQPSTLNTKSKDYVYHIERKLGIKVYWQPIQNIVDEILKSDSIYMKNAPELTETGKSTIHAVLRTVLGLEATHRFKSGIVSTGNHTECILGWFSYKDIGSTGVHAIIGDLTKVELYELSDYINKEIYNDEVIPFDLYDDTFKPAAELPDAMDDPIDYWVQSGICASLIRDRKNKDDLIWDYMNHSLNDDYFPKMDEIYKYDIDKWIEQVEFAIKKMKSSVYKCAQSAPNVIISPRSRGFSNRETLINKYTY